MLTLALLLVPTAPEYSTMARAISGTQDEASEWDERGGAYGWAKTKTGRPKPGLPRRRLLERRGQHEETEGEPGGGGRRSR